MKMINADYLISTLEDIQSDHSSELIKYGLELAIQAVVKQLPTPEPPRPSASLLVEAFNLGWENGKRAAKEEYELKDCGKSKENRDTMTP